MVTEDEYLNLRPGDIVSRHGDAWQVDGWDRGKWLVHSVRGTTGGKYLSWKPHVPGNRDWWEEAVIEYLDPIKSLDQVEERLKEEQWQ